MKSIKTHFLKTSKSIFLLLLSMVVSLAGYAQTPTNIGIGTVLPDPSAVLHLNSLTQGFLLPRFTDGSIAAITSPADGLLIYNTDKKEFQYWDNTAWQTFPSWQQNGTHIFKSNSGNVGIGTNAPSTALEVNGTVTATSYALTGANSNGPVPKGTIVMWGGLATSIPFGWALCDGSAAPASLTAIVGPSLPDLRDRFVVGAGNSYPVNNTGGQNTVALVAANLPPHVHEANGNGATINITASGNHSHTANQLGQDWTQIDGDDGSDLRYGSNSSEGFYTPIINPSTHTHTNAAFAGTTGNGVGLSGTSIENRPPYWALCYIIKL